MQQLTGINIRKGIELEIPIPEILKIDTSPTGDARVKHFYQDCDCDENKADKNFLDDLKENGVIQYREFLTSSDLQNDLNIIIFNNYISTYTKLSKKRIECVSYPELIFVNNKTLGFEDFCMNFMTAQAFTGNFPKDENRHAFIAVCDFEIDEVIPLLPMIYAGECSVEYVFVYYNKIYSSIMNIICGALDTDIKEQKEYLTDKEYKKIRANLKKHQAELEDIYKSGGLD